MNVCNQFEERVIAEAAGDLETLQRPALEAHLHECGACRMQLASEQRLFASIDAGVTAMVVGEPAPEFVANVMAQLTGEAERKLLAAIDAGVAQTVAAELSPAFAAAVRQRIAAGPAPQPSRFSLPWWVPAAGAVAAAVLLAVVLWPRNSQVTVTHQASAVRNVQAKAVHPTPPVAARLPVRPARKGKSTIVPVPILASASKPAEPEVLVSDEERRVVTRFYRFVQEGRINPSEVLAENKVTLAVLLKELATPELGLRAQAVKTLDLVTDPRSTSDQK